METSTRSHAADIGVRGNPLANQFAGFSLARVTVNEIEHPRLGYAAEYNVGAAVKATIYIYDLQLPDIPDGSDTPLVLSEFRRSGDEIFELYNGLKQPRRSTVPTASRPDCFFGADFLIPNENTPNLSISEAHC